MERNVCIHGHFYQPPRENPWLEAIEVQDSAYPYHDWNERITSECYAPNASSRILDPDGWIVRIVNNYAKISFNFGPTLLSWIEMHTPWVYQAILAADRESQKNFSGHGSAMAQAYNHIILPLANSRDKRTQVIWGIRDFEHRFGRPPEGMWLPETAVDFETLDLLAQHGIKFTVLAPNQARRVRAMGARNWRDVSNSRIDPSMPYRLRLRSDRSVNLFFYDGPISRSAAFENVLEKGENLANRLAGSYNESRGWPQLLHMATDGETYGHHRRHADMALAYALHFIEANQLARITNYAEFLQNHPPTHEVQIFENSSWSCVHGVERWRRNCGCNSGMHSGWTQDWRTPLRDALDWLRDRLAERYEQLGATIFKDPWLARDEYISVILDRSPHNINAFLARHALRERNGAQRVAALKLLEMQRHAMLMYTSCGWFFDELSGLETVQVVQYAGRALQLAQELSGDHIEGEFLSRLEGARSNLPEHGDGRRIFEKCVRPAMVTLEKVGAHYAINSLFDNYPEDEATVYSHTVVRERYRLFQEGKMRLALGRATVTSRITGESESVTFGVLHLGDQNVHGGVRPSCEDEDYEALESEVGEIFASGDVPAIVHAVDRHFAAGTFSLRLLFRDEQRKIVRMILDSALHEAAALYRNFYAQHATLARFVAELGIPLPDRFRMAIDSALHEELLAALSKPDVEPDRVTTVLEQIPRAGAQVDAVTAEYTWRRTVEQVAHEFSQAPVELERIRRFESTMTVSRMLPFEVNLWQVQNIYYEAMTTHLSGVRERAHSGDTEAEEWLRSARALAEFLRVRGEPERAEARA